MMIMPGPGPSLAILRYGVTPRFPITRTRARVSVRKLRRGELRPRERWPYSYRCTDPACQAEGRGYRTPGAASDGGRGHLRRWHR